MGISILVRQHLYIKAAPAYSLYQQYNDCWCGLVMWSTRASAVILPTTSALNILLPKSLISNNGPDIKQNSTIKANVDCRKSKISNLISTCNICSLDSPVFLLNGGPVCAAVLHRIWTSLWGECCQSCPWLSTTSCKETKQIFLTHKQVFRAGLKKLKNTLFVDKWPRKFTCAKNVPNCLLFFFQNNNMTCEILHVLMCVDLCGCPVHIFLSISLTPKLLTVSIL